MVTQSINNEAVPSEEIAKAEPLKMSASSKAKDREKRARRLANIFVGEMIPLLVQVRQDFLDKPKNELILGCKTFTTYCRTVLRYSPSHIRRLIAGQNPATAKHDGSKKRRAMQPWIVKTPDGTLVSVARSAVQKAIRDGDESAAVYWMRQLYLTGITKVWKALKVFSFEDIGLADLSVKTHVLELQQMAEDCKTDGHQTDLLPLLLATMICARAKKSRNADDAAIWFNEHPTFVMPTPEEAEVLAAKPQPSIPDKVFDKHTCKGRSMGRGLEHFKNEAAVLTNESDVAPFTPPVVVEQPTKTDALPKPGDTGSQVRKRAVAFRQL